MAWANKGATEVIFYATDGYSSSIPIKEAYSDRVILATHMNGEILSDKHGLIPFKACLPGTLRLQMGKMDHPHKNHKLRLQRLPGVSRL